MPEKIIIPFIEGDGIGPDIWWASKKIFDATIKKVYNGKRKIEWNKNRRFPDGCFWHFL